MKVAEKNLLLAVRNQLRTAALAGGAGLSEAECQIELMEMAPATQGNRYIAVMPGGWIRGPRHNSSGGVNDLVYGIDIFVATRALSRTPRDRMLANLTELNTLIDRIYPVLDFNYTAINAANALILADTGSTEGFVEPLRFAAVEKRPRVVDGEVFGGTGVNAGVARTIQFHGARRITSK